VASPTKPTGDLIRIGATLVEVLPSDPVRPAGLGWDRAEPIEPGILNLMTAASQIDAALATRAIEHLLAWPETYTPDEVLVPTARTFAKLMESKAWSAVNRLREAALDHLRRRIAQALEPPRDWARNNPLKCSCADCRSLGAFWSRRINGNGT
jgi:hypothetical protein